MILCAKCMSGQVGSVSGVENLAPYTSITRLNVPRAVSTRLKTVNPFVLNVIG